MLAPVALPDASRRAGEGAGKTRVAPRVPPLALALCAGLLGAAIACYDVTRPGALHGIIQYDDGVYYAAAARLVSGVLPYRSFAFVQPPGIALLLAPLAFLAHGDTRAGLAAARLVTALVAGANAFLAGAAVAHRGRIAAATAGLVLAVDPVAFLAFRTVLLEPYLVLFCLLGVVVAFPNGRLGGPWRLFFAGALFGLGAAVKAWAVVFLVALALAATLLRRAPAAGRALGALGAGALAAGLATDLPFLVAAPGAMWREVVVGQLERPATPHHLIVMVTALTGLHGLNISLPPAAAVIVAVAALLCGLLGSLVPTLRGRGDRLEAFALLASAGALASVFAAGEFYDHYAYVPTAFGALVAGCAAARGAVALRRRVARGAWRAWSRVATLCLAGALVALVGSETAVATRSAAHAGDPAIAVDLAVPKGVCAVSDAAILLVEADRLDTRASCPAVVDPTGAALAAAPNTTAADQLAAPSFVAWWERALTRATFFVRSPSGRRRLPDTAGFAAFVARNYARLPDPGAAVFVRRSSPLAHRVLNPALWTMRRLRAAGWRPPARH